MKKILLLLLFVTIFSFISCVSSNDALFQGNLTISNRSYDTIEGTTTVNQLKIRTLGSMGVYRHTLLFLEYITPGSTFYTIDVWYDGQGWRFYENIDLKLDAQIYNFLIDNPRRDVISGSRVQEKLSKVLSDTLVNEIQQASSLTVGVSTNLFVITPEELAVIKDFLAN